MGRISENIIVKVILSKKYRLHIHLILLIMLIAVLIGFANKWSAAGTICSIAISGNNIIPSSEIKCEIDTSIYPCLKNEINLSDLRNKVKGHPYIYSSFVSYKSKSRINIEVIERIPIAILIRNDGNLCYIDKFGYQLPYRISSEIKDLPVFRGLFTSNKLDSTALVGALSILNQLEINENNILNKLISELKFNRAKKSYQISVSEFGYLVDFGKAEYISEKIALFDSFWREEISNYQPSDIKQIDVRWKDRVILSMLDTKS